MTSILFRASARGSNSLGCGLGLGLGAGRRVSHIQRRLQSHSAKVTGDTQKVTEAQKTVSDAVSTPAGATVGATVGATALTARPLWERLGPLTTAAQAYGRAQSKRPYTTQILSAIAIYLCADLSAQYLGGNEYDPARTARNLIIGSAIAVPHYKWFFWLSNNFNYSSRWLSVAAKVVFSQLVFTPVFNTYFFGSQALLSGDGISGAIARIQHTVPATFVSSAKFWPPFTAFSILFIPVEYRAIFAGCIAVVWQTYLSFVNRRAEILEESEAKMEKAVVEVGKVVNVKAMAANPDNAKLVTVAVAAQAQAAA
ncbi:hypothetical protein BGZ63DRAFT_426997 [Mariannaea sp. PMI_226]|nr:hypothetical protein BGZ63DRAFT_426997 [Mariannaea sp. PMI_226]